MTIPAAPLPIIGQPNSTEDPKIRAALAELQTILTSGLDSTNLAPAASWTNLTLATGITSTGAKSAAARIEIDGTVRLRGIITNGTGSAIASGNVLATLPAGCWPPNPIYFPVSLFVSTAYRIQINTSGQILTAGAASLSNTDAIYLDGVTFAP